MSDQHQISPRSWAVLAVLCGAIFLEGIDAAMLNLALPAIRAEMGLSTTELSAIAGTYVLGYAGFMLLGGRAADLYGRRRVFLLALGVFLVFSGLGGLATDGWTIILARFVTGVAAAFMTPAGLSLVTTNFPQGAPRQRAVLIYGAAASAGFSLGLVAGGFLTAFGWRWVFFTPMIVSAVILVAALFLIEDRGPRAQADRFDVAGAVTLTSSMLAMVYGIMRLEYGFDGLGISAAFIALGTVLFAVFLRIERRAPDPIVRLDLLASVRLVRVNLAGLLFVASFFGFQFLVSIYLQELLGWSAWDTALALIVISIDALIAPTVTPYFVRMYGAIKVLFVGLLCAVVAYAATLPLDMDWGYRSLLPATILLGFAFSFAYGPLTIAATEGVADEEQGLASGLINTSFQFGAGVGLAVTGAVMALAQAGGGQVELDAIRTAMFVPLLAAVLAAVLAAGGLRRSEVVRQAA